MSVLKILKINWWVGRKEERMDGRIDRLRKFRACKFKMLSLFFLHTEGTQRFR